MNINRISNQAIVGLLVVVIGVLLLLDTTGVIRFSIFRWIPSLFIVFGLWRLVANGFQHVFGPLLIIVIAGFVQFSFLGIDIGSLWPVILIVIGLSILLGGRQFRRREQWQDGADDLNSWNVLGKAKRHVTSDNFEGGQATVLLGEIEIDLREAAVTDPPATIEATAVMGELKLKVPSHWSVDADTLNLMGSVEDKREHSNVVNKAPDLIVKGLVLMGGLEIDD